MKLIKKGGIWHVSIRTALGKTKTITTRCTDRAQALRVIKESRLKDLELAARAGRLSNEAVGYITAGRKMTVLSAVDPYRRWMQVIGLSPRTIERNMSTVLLWAETMKIQNASPAAVSEEHVNSFVNDPTSKRKLASRKLLLGSIRSFFGFLAAKGWCVRNPSALVRVRMEALTHDQKEPRKRRPFTEEEFARLLSVIEERYDQLRNELEAIGERLAAQGKPTDQEESWGGKYKALEDLGEKIRERLKRVMFWRCATILGRYSGLRLGDIVCLQWASLQSPDALVVWTDKSDTRVQVPMNQQVFEAVRSVERTDMVWCFPSEQLNYIKKRPVFSVEFGRLCKEAGLPGLSFHCLRHTFLTECSAKGMTRTEIAAIAGHSSVNTTDHYLHPISY